MAIWSVLSISTKKTLPHSWFGKVRASVELIEHSKLPMTICNLKVKAAFYQIF